MGNTIRGNYFLTDKQKNAIDGSENAWREQAMRAERIRQMRFRDEIPQVVLRAFTRAQRRAGMPANTEATWEEVHTWLTGLIANNHNENKS